MELYAKLNLYYKRAYIRSIRLVFFLFIITLIIYQLLSDQSLHSIKITLFLFNLFLMNEIFFRYKINKAKPGLTIDKNKGKNIFDSFTLPALSLLINEGARSEFALIKKLFKYPQIRCFMQKTNIREKDIVMHPIAAKTLASSALEVARTFHGKFVTTLDVFIAYLLFNESEDKLLFAKQLKSDDLNNLVYWLRQEYPAEENPRKKRLQFTGGGIGEALIAGWTPETKKYAFNFTCSALKNKALITGREKEFKAILEGLIKAENNNVLLVGDIGSGKENLVKAFAYHSFEGNLGSFLNYRRVLELMVGALTAGASNRNELESRLQTIISEISHAVDVILYIPDFQNLMGASSYDLDISGALLPYLQSGNLPVIATISTGNYKTYLERNPIKEVFNVIELKEPDKNTAIQMVLEKTREIEKKNNCIISYRAIAGAVELAGRFLQDSVLPGNAISLLENVSNKVALSEAPFFEHTRKKVVTEEDVVKHIEDTVHVAIAMPDKKEIDLLLHLEDKLHQRVIGQQEAVTSIAEAMRRARSGLSLSQKPISFLFLGPTGVGKTETTKALADLYYGGEKNMIRLDMSEYTDEIGIRRLLGAPPGEGNERGELTDKIHAAPASLVLLDEFEKAHPKIHNLFLQVLDDGRLTDNKGVTVSFDNALIIATSNAGSEFIREEVGSGAALDKKFHTRLLDYLQTNKIFKPELLNRFDGVITFKPLGQPEVRKVVQLLLNKIIKDLDKQDIKITFDDAIIEKIANEGFDQEFGARPLHRYIQDNIEDLIAKRKLIGEVVRGKNINVGIDGTNNINITVI
ncbi:ATP-dependent Clp protease ATP-binding subunit [Patescibacteria group bacterium]|nr:ATP-dependent Clp protease ATP-binding subunit [Patescibacteria group bacterium]